MEKYMEIDDLITPKEHSAFVDVDREEEDKAVTLYQTTKDPRLFEKIYNIRLQTLQIWARRYHYLMDSKEDAFGEFSKCFSKAVNEYNKDKGTFNTCLFTFLINHVRNINVRKNKTKKRKPIFLDPTIKNNNFLYSLEYSYRDGKNSTTNTLKDIIPDTKNKKDNAFKNMSLEETINGLSHNCPTIKGFLRRLGEGGTLASVIKEYRIKSGKIRIGRNLAKKMRKKKSRILAKKLIKKEVNTDKFSLINYVIKNNNLRYTIELRKTKESSLILSAVRKFRKNKSFFRDKMAL